MDAKLANDNDIVTIELNRTEAVNLTVALTTEVDSQIARFLKCREMRSWDDLAIMGKVRDLLFPLLSNPYPERGEYDNQ